MKVIQINKIGFANEVARENNIATASSIKSARLRLRILLLIGIYEMTENGGNICLRRDTTIVFYQTNSASHDTIQVIRMPSHTSHFKF